MRRPWLRSLVHRRRPTLPPELFRCWSRSAGSQPTDFFSPTSASTCSAGRRFSLRPGASPRCRRRRRPPELKHTAFAWRRRTPRPYALDFGFLKAQLETPQAARFGRGRSARTVCSGKDMHAACSNHVNGRVARFVRVPRNHGFPTTSPCLYGFVSY
jgi:hypothetical protein